MTGRINRLWQPGNPQNRVFFPDFWLRLVETPSVGYNRLPKNAAKFEVDPRMSRYDVQEYLEKIYKLPVREVRIRNEMGEITWNAPLDSDKRKALWKEDDRKFAFVFFPKNFTFYFPTIFKKDEFEDEIKKVQKFNDDDRTNEKYVNRDRAGMGEFFGI
uniref:Large ribosomal subunit protein uL23m n=1 Tax=Panagrolaimus superbus TaxID=310955 RepID=A0A914YZR9_9BILA